jgi:putative ABC transport system ATP-binding protein
MEILRNLWRRKARRFSPSVAGEVDTDTANALLAFMRRINAERGVTFVIVTHDLDLAARTDRVIRLRDGHVISDARPSVQPVPQAAA